MGRVSQCLDHGSRVIHAEADLLDWIHEADFEREVHILDTPSLEPGQVTEAKTGAFVLAPHEQLPCGIHCRVRVDPRMNGNDPGLADGKGSEKIRSCI